MFEIDLSGEHRQEQLGSQLAQVCSPPCVIYLQGDLGAGKTTLVRGFLRGLGYQGNVKSPTYTLLEPYVLADCACYHFDLYRLADPEELEYLGIQDLLEDNAILLVEWPERGEGVLPAPDLMIQLRHTGAGRHLEFLGESPVGASIVAALQRDKTLDLPEI